LLTKQKKPAAIAAERPALNSIEPYASLSSRWADLTKREDELTNTLRPLVAEIRAAGGYAERGGVPVRPAEGPTDYKPGLRELVADILPFQPREPAPLSALEQQKAKAAEMSRELTNIAEAKRVLLPRLNRARAEASAAVCDAVRPDYAAIAERISSALIELGNAWGAHLVFLRELAAESVSTTTLQQMTIGDLDDPLATIGRSLRRAVECGYCDPNDVPPEWLAR
jgi:hypothetical protein